MYMLFVIALLLGVSVNLATTSVQQFAVTHVASNAVASAQALGVLANAASLYQQAHPSANGAVGASSLGLPVWFSAPAASGAVMSAGLCYPYIMPANTADAAALIAELTRRGFVAGIATGGALHSPGGALVAGAPTAIPAGAVAIVQ